MELTNFNWPKDSVLDWILGPLLVMKEQIRSMELSEDEAACLRKLLLTRSNEKPEDWDDCGFPSDDDVRRAQLQAIIRRYFQLFISAKPLLFRAYLKLQIISKAFLIEF